MEDRIKIDLHEGVADVRLTRADKMNALDDAMFGALVATGENLKTHKGVRAVVLSGEGRAFHLQTSGDREGPWEFFSIALR
jgi:enoyl-CoA hydratase/carnithine racemase